MDEVEELARERAKELFGAEYVNVQPHSGAQANMGTRSSGKHVNEEHNQVPGIVKENKILYKSSCF